MNGIQDHVSRVLIFYFSCIWYKIAGEYDFKMMPLQQYLHITYGMVLWGALIMKYIYVETVFVWLFLYAIS
jgi:hypothetical protein